MVVITPVIVAAVPAAVIVPAVAVENALLSPHEFLCCGGEVGVVTHDNDLTLGVHGVVSGGVER